MRIPKFIVPALALASAVPARAADPATDTTQQQLEVLKARVADLEKTLQGGKPAAAAPAPAGMTPEQEAEFNRIRIKAEALEDSRDASGWKGLKLSGYTDPTYVYNRNKDRGTFQYLVPASREPYAYDNSYFGSVALDLQKETENGTKFRLTLVPVRSAGDFQQGASIVHEATVWVPLGSQSTKLFAGQLPDWSGYEMLPPTQNKLITHNLLFDTTLPYVYVGAGLEFLVGKYDLKFMLCNFNQPIRDLGQSKPMLVTRGDYTGGEFWGLGWAGAAGWKPNLRAKLTDANGARITNPITGEGYNPNDSFYGTFELDGWYTRGALSLAAHVTYGQQERAAMTEDPITGKLRNAEWIGGSVLVAYKLTPRLEVALRGDYVWNEKNGGGLLDYVTPDAITGVGPEQGNPDANPSRGANRWEGSTAISYAVNANVTVKAEYRYDGADRKVFGNRGVLGGAAEPKYLKDNHLVASSMVFSF